MFINDLRTATKSSHQALDSFLIPKIKGINSAGDYGSLLECFYGYFSPVEQAINGHLNDVIVPFYNDRRKAKVIKDELNTVDATKSGNGQSSEIPAIEDIASAYGAMYVLEGSTLGGKIISTMISNSLQIPVTDIRFFNYYGENTDKMWMSFVETLNKYAEGLSEPERERIIHTANDTFHLFKKWIEAYYN